MKIEFAERTSKAGGVLALVAFEGEPAAAAERDLDGAANGAVARARAIARFTGADGQTLDLIAPAGSTADRLVLVGAGPRASLGAASARNAGARAYATASKIPGPSQLTLLADDLSPEHAAEVAFGVELAAYRFDRYRTQVKPESKPTIDAVVIETSDAAGAQRAYAPLEAIAAGVTFARDLVSEPANVLHPEEFARRVAALTSMGLEVEILGEAEMEALGMAALVAVGRGSVRQSQLAVIQWRGAEDPDAQPLAFVGKGVCFDSGGISIKPADGMEDMKWDMGGAGAVAGLMHALAGRKARVNVVGILGLVENMPDGDAQRPGDVVTSMSGRTIEVINTDAEGRLVLADALWYCQNRFKPAFMIDLATLTGAVIVSLGNDYAGLFSNDDVLAGKLLAASTQEAEWLWRLPLPPQYEKLIESPIADLKNIGGRAAGSITAALFLQHFVNGLPWAHLDIASTAWKKPSSTPTIPDGATGFGVRLLDRFVAENYEP